MWMARRIHAFLTLLPNELDLIQDSATLRDALEASVFFANSMGRLGADFTAQLPKIFESKMLGLVESIWIQGVVQLQETLRVCAEAGIVSPLVSQSQESVTFLETSSLPLDGPQAPPRMLLALPPLGRLVNAILTGLNELRRCLLPGIFATLRTILERQVIEAVKSTLAYHERAVLKPGLRGEAAQLREVAARYKLVVTDVLDPYLRGSLYAAIGNKQGAERFHLIYLDSLKASEVPVDGDDNNEVPVDGDDNNEARRGGDHENPVATDDAVDTEGETTDDAVVSETMTNESSATNTPDA
jgi:conserved oligomeric Golgi complex subunit 8